MQLGERLCRAKACIVMEARTPKRFGFEARGLRFGAPEEACVVVEIRTLIKLVKPGWSDLDHPKRQCLGCGGTPLDLDYVAWVASISCANNFGRDAMRIGDAMASETAWKLWV